LFAEVLVIIEICILLESNN